MRSLVTIGVAGLIVLGLATTSVAQAPFYACVVNDGTIRMVPTDTSCRKNETLISWNNVGPQGPAGPAGPAGASGGSPVVWDSSTPQKRVGTFLAVMNFGLPPQFVLFEHEGTWLLAAVTSDGFAAGLSPLRFYYRDTVCGDGPYLFQGLAYVPFIAKEVLNVSAAGIGYYPVGEPIDPPAPPSPMDPPPYLPNASYREGSLAGTCTPYVQWGGSGKFYAVGSVDLSGFAAPFVLK